jgi:hypothetical protein
MADTPLFSGGTHEFKAYHCADTPQFYRPPFAQPHMEGSPVADSLYDAAAPRVGCVASQPLFPSINEIQRKTILHFKPEEGEILQLLLIPCNHYVTAVRFDISQDDPDMAGATVSIAGQMVTADPDDPETKYDVAEDQEFEDAATAQGLSDIPLHKASTNVLWLSKLVGGGATGTAPGGTDGGPITDGAATGYVIPYYVPPQTLPWKAKNRNFMTGGLLLGVKIKSAPTNSAVTLADMKACCYMGATIFGFDFKQTV